jgi:predicted regulator of Ras-like GTPase activity (Roadblock/LC7/MglB family)
MAELSKEAQNINWLVNNFVERVPGVVHTVAVSSDGLLLAFSQELDRAAADQLSALSSGLSSLAQGTADHFGGGRVSQTIVEMEHGFLFVTSISDGSLLAVLAELDCNIDLIGYEMAMVVARTGDALTPALRAELQASLPR